LPQPGEFGLGGVACLEGRISFGTGSRRLRSSLHKFLKQLGAEAVKPGDLVLWRRGGREYPGASQANSGH
jgi:ribosomal protein L27